ncbi:MULTISPECIES: hypothetical protein [Streptomyces]|uniref:Transposase n=1 Tax=Streptomyces flaveolus TaxID=67297 RepID=A0ABV3A2N9_9ACTN|nr:MULTISPECIES: hypothetical protein [Streptomyces]KMS85261.1 hypothetical protein ACZ91_43215 [Streptomyces regensis]KOG75799.1 hypothetical protein ADK77_01665 [Streptomyces antibioticus]
MDLDAVADELYGLRPEEFVATRDRRALDARKAGDQALAKEIGALRRPSLAAWVSNLLVRRQPEQVQPLLGLGEELRRAHRELDGTQLRKLARRQNEVIGALGRQARQLAAQAGHPVGEGVQREVEETLHAALADPEAAREWAAGRLVKPLSSMIGFPAADEVLLGRRPTPEPRKPARGKGRKEDEARQEDKARKEREDREKEEQRRRLAEAREAERELRAQQEVADAAARAVVEAGARLAEAEERVRELRERLRDAEEEQQRARAAERDARDRERQAGRAVREARRRAEKAAAELERPAAGAGSRG